jgi:hypothetical protein
MLISFSFTRIAVTVRRWFEVTPEAVMEHGSRIELGLLAPQPHRGTESAAQKLVIDQAFWRADLFNKLDRPASSFSAAHFHPHFDDVEPSARQWSTDLTDDPWSWLADQLTQIEARLSDAGLDPAIAVDDADDIRGFIPQIVDTARQFSPEDPMSRDADFALTKDAAERVRRMLVHVPTPDLVDRDYLGPWISQR